MKKVSAVIPTMNRSKDTIACIDSLLDSDYSNVEVVVVDNASTDDTVEKIKEKFGSNKAVKLIESPVNLSAAGGKNAGAKEATGDYLLFVDSDNIVHEKMISYLVDFMGQNKECGMVGPLMLYKKNPKIIWLYFADINMFTSQAHYKGTGEKDAKQYNEIVEVGHLPNCFIVRSQEFKKTGGFDNRYSIVYEEADLAEQVKQKLKKKVYLYSKAITYHNIELPKATNKKDLSFRSETRAYLLARNRVLFMRRNATLMQKLAFFAVFNPIILAYYMVSLLIRKEYKNCLFYVKGSFKGLVYK